MTIEMGTAELTGMTLAEIKDSLSVEARSALAATRGARIGTVVQTSASSVMAAKVLGELHYVGLVGLNGGLTVRGSALAEKLQREYLDRMFG